MVWSFGLRRASPLWRWSLILLRGLFQSPRLPASLLAWDVHASGENALVALKAAMLAAVQDFWFPGGWIVVIGCAMRSLSRWLISEETEQPFFRCVSCRLPLLEIDAPWLVNKDYFRGECVLEYAICQPCRGKISAKVPEATKAAVRTFLEAEINWPLRLAEHLGHGGEELRFGRCIACLNPRGEIEGFAISALFDAEGYLVEGPLPLLMCKDCYGRMTSLLCDTSRAIWRGFLSENFEEPFDPDSLGDLGIF